jgi:tetratricopeptide (TPR) repeat protein
MRSTIRLWLLLTAGLLCTNSFGQAIGRDMTRETAIWDGLRTVAPDLVETFTQATEQFDAGDYMAAATLYRKVLQSAPDFDPAMRRLGACLAQSGDPQHGIPLLEKAVQTRRSPENLATLAQFVAFPGGAEAPREAQERALVLVQEAIRLAAVPDAHDLFLEARLASALERQADFREAVREMMERYPNLAASHYVNASRAAMDEDWTAAEAALNTAERLGLPADATQDVRDAVERNRAGTWRFVRYPVYLVAAWLGGLGLLFALGKALSRKTVQSIEHADPSGIVSSKELRLRKAYRRLIDIAGQRRPGGR